MGTETHLETDISTEAEATRLPALTVLWHHDLERVGELALLTPLASGRSVALSRLEPKFAAASHTGQSHNDGRPRPLAAARLSRTPVHLRPAAGGGVALDPGDSRTRVEADGESVTGPVEFAGERLDEGVVLLLGGAVTLLLHRVDPALPRRVHGHGMLGISPGIARVRLDVERVADLGVPVLLRGETGTGKELAARAIHAAGPRADRAFVAVNMAAVPPSLAAAELFGARKGAFTGADSSRDGLFRRAQGGTLFLDEVGETPADVQPLLLRALEDGEVRPVGGGATVRVDVRVISATDLDLEAAIEEESFRAPLLHRLAGFTLRLPPLRRRREDLGILVRSFLRREMQEVGEAHRLQAGDTAWLAASAVARMARHPWPGNVRQLANVVRSLVIANRGSEQAQDLRPLADLAASEAKVSQTNPSQANVPAAAGSAAAGPRQAGPRQAGPRQAGPRQAGPRRAGDVTEAELLAAMERQRYRPQAAAEELGIPRASIYDLIGRSRSLRKATDLDADEIREALESNDGHEESAAEQLKVSAQALRRRMGQLGLR